MEILKFQGRMELNSGYASRKSFTGKEFKESLLCPEKKISGYGGDASLDINVKKKESNHEQG